YLADGYSGLQIINVANPRSPILLSSCDTPGWAQSVSVVGNTAYVADRGAGLQIINVANPQNPILIGSYNTPGYAYSVSVVGNTAYVADWNAGLQIINVTNPQNPSLLGSFNMTGLAMSVTVVRNIAYVADYIGLKIINVANPQSPTMVGEYHSSGRSCSVTVVGNLAYVAEGKDGLNILDISNPYNPTSLGRILRHLTSQIKTCLVKSNLLFFSDINWNEISCYDISNPNSPELVENIVWNLSTSEMCVEGDKLYMANESYGLGILDLRDVDIEDALLVPAPEVVLSSYPNPFHVGTTIEFTLPKSEQVKLSLYNIKGQLVRELCDENKQSGSYSLEWDGRDRGGRNVPVGIYLAKISYGNKSFTKKITRW
ncbi:MAG: T9SS type A sorting domain-containing protein, partial [Candidatus Cloacimonetes bacterium]|nr:T9SS type A sorting domain-containing protein [Candidatus Cloacimonadota bacterium]